MSSKRPFAWLAVLAKASVRAAMEPSVFPVTEDVPESVNQFGLRMFALPQTETVEFPTNYTTWLKYLPTSLIFHGCKPAIDETSVEISFDETVIFVGETTRDGALSKFLLPDGKEYPIVSGLQDCVMAAFKTKDAANTWLNQKVRQFEKELAVKPS